MEYVIVCMANPWKILSISTGILTGFGGVTPPGICRGKWSRQINWGHQSGQSGTSSIVSLPFAKTNVSVSFVKTKMLGQLHALRQFNLCDTERLRSDRTGRHLRREPLIKAELALWVLRKVAHRVQFNEHNDGSMILKHACKMGLEGIVSKRLGSRYRSGRSPDWLQFKTPEAPAVKREAEEDWGG